MLLVFTFLGTSAAWAADSNSSQKAKLSPQGNPVMPVPATPSNVQEVIDQKNQAQELADSAALFPFEASTSSGAIRVSASSVDYSPSFEPPRFYVPYEKINYTLDLASGQIVYERSQKVLNPNGSADGEVLAHERKTFSPDQGEEFQKALSEILIGIEKIKNDLSGNLETKQRLESLETRLKKFQPSPAISKPLDEKKMAKKKIEQTLYWSSKPQHTRIADLDSKDYSTWDRRLAQYSFPDSFYVEQKNIGVVDTTKNQIKIVAISERVGGLAADVSFNKDKGLLTFKTEVGTEIFTLRDGMAFIEQLSFIRYVVRNLWDYETQRYSAPAPFIPPSWAQERIETLHKIMLTLNEIIHQAELQISQPAVSIRSKRTISP